MTRTTKMMIAGAALGGLLAGASTRAMAATAPAGSGKSIAAARQTAEFAGKKEIWLVVDLCYEQLIYDAVPHNLPRVLFERHRDRFGPRRTTGARPVRGLSGLALSCLRDLRVQVTG